MNFKEALQYLLSLGHETLAIKLGLTNIERLLKAVGHPQKSYQSVQIAGTNGKGSTAVMLDAITRAASINTGLYTSPHLMSITERIRVRGQDIRQEDFARLTTEVRDASQKLLAEGALPSHPTYFEHVTAIALLAFREAEVQLAILETGLGGRLDATTAVCAPLVAITPIALDHQEYLGEQLELIAAEKAAIIRPGATAIVAPQPPIALEVIKAQCAASLVEPRIDECRVEVHGWDGQGRARATFATKQDRYENVLVGLRGRHQLVNASVAIGLAEALCERGFDISRDHLIEGIEGARHAGRLELREGAPGILFDGAHNPASARALQDYLREFINAPVTMVFSAMRDKDLSEMAATLFPLAEHLILTRPDNPRASSLESLRRVVPPDYDASRITETSSLHEALRAAREITPGDGLILLTGSLYLVGEAQKILLDEASAGVAA
jgi:dihydrofolate synthase/folylpolyglutamate synthase